MYTNARFYFPLYGYRVFFESAIYTKFPASTSVRPYIIFVHDVRRGENNCSCILWLHKHANDFGSTVSDDLHGTWTELNRTVSDFSGEAKKTYDRTGIHALHR